MAWRVRIDIFIIRKDYAHNERLFGDFRSERWSEHEGPTAAAVVAT